MLSARRSPHLLLGIFAFLQIAPRAPCRDGEIVAAARKERFTRRKFDARSPTNAVGYCQQEGRIEQ
jgi:carbamoyltransferase